MRVTNSSCSLDIQKQFRKSTARPRAIQGRNASGPVKRSCFLIIVVCLLLSVLATCVKSRYDEPQVKDRGVPPSISLGIVNSQDDELQASGQGTLDVVLPSGHIDCSLVECVSRLASMLMDVRNIYIIVPGDLEASCRDKFHNLENETSSVNILCVDEELILPRRDILFGEVNAQGWSAPIGRYNWYYQQLIKLSFGLHPGFTLSPNFMIWDSDSVLMTEYSPFVDGKSRYIMRHKESCGKGVRLMDGKPIDQYWPATRDILARNTFSASDVLKHYDCQSVVHQMLVNKKTLVELFKHVCGNHFDIVGCANKILSFIPSDSPPGYALAEYALYFTWSRMTRPEEDLYIDRNTKYARIHGIKCGKELRQRLSQCSNSGYTYAVVEKIHSPSAKRRTTYPADCLSPWR